MKNEELMKLTGLYTGPKGVQQIWSYILANFVAQVAGKGLSTEDFTTELLTKLTNIANGAQVNVLESVKVNNAVVDITDKAVNIKVPVGTLADLNEVSEENLAAALLAKLNGKVDAVEGMGLSHNDYDDAEKAEVAKIKDKVDKQEGMGLSHNDYDDAAKAEVAKIVGKANAADVYTKEQADQSVDDKIKVALTSVYKVMGSIDFANLSLVGVAEGYTYNVRDAFTSTEDFKDGAGVKYPAGTNVTAINVGTDEEPEYKWDPQAGTYDFSNFVQKNDIRELTAEEIASICVMPGAEQTE